MGCGCKDKASLTPDARGLRQTYPVADESGTILLHSDGECSGPYSGPLRNADVIIVGLRTPDERLFLRGQRTAAVKYAQENRLSFDRVKASQLCVETVAALVG